MTCPTCSGTVQCVSCRMEGRPPPKLRAYPGRPPLPGSIPVRTVTRRDLEDEDEDQTPVAQRHDSKLPLVLR